MCTRMSVVCVGVWCGSVDVYVDMYICGMVVLVCVWYGCVGVCMLYGCVGMYVVWLCGCGSGSSGLYCGQTERLHAMCFINLLPGHAHCSNTSTHLILGIMAALAGLKG